MRRLYPYLLLAITTLIATPYVAIAVPIDPKNPPQGRFSDEWLEIHMAGGKVGYAHATMNRDGDLTC